MCNYRLLPVEVEQQVRSHLPSPTKSSPIDAIVLIDQLETIAARKKPNYDANGKPYYHVLINEISDMLCNAYTHRQIGGLSRAMGLGARRTGAGYEIYWNQKQLDILKGFLWQYHD